MKKHSWKERENKKKAMKNMQEYTVNVKNRFTSLPLLSKNLLIYFERFLEEKFCITFTVFPYI